VIRVRPGGESVANLDDREATTMATDNIATIKSIYEAFGRGDTEYIVAQVTDDVDWAAEASGKGAPWYGTHRGPDGVRTFFEQFG
jgi:uncharacterized protein